MLWGKQEPKIRWLFFFPWIFLGFWKVYLQTQLRWSWYTSVLDTHLFSSQRQQQVGTLLCSSHLSLPHFIFFIWSYLNLSKFLPISLCCAREMIPLCTSLGKSTSLDLCSREPAQERGWEDCKPEVRKGRTETVSSGRTGILLSWAHSICDGLHKINPVNVPAWSREDPRSFTPDWGARPDTSGIQGARL